MKYRDLHVNKKYNRQVLPSKGGHMNNNNQYNIGTTSPDEYSSLERWHLPGCAIAASWHHFQQ